MHWGVDIPDEQLNLKNYRKHECQRIPMWNIIYCLEDKELILGHTTYIQAINYCPWCGKTVPQIGQETGPTFQAYNWSPGPP